MPASYSDRLNGLTTSVAIKPACRVRTTANITLSGTQTIDGISVVADDRVLVVAQTDATENGIWKASASAWERADDFDGAGDAVHGTLVTVLSGGTISGSPLWKLTSSDSVEIGTSDITFSAADFQFTGSVGTMASQSALAVNIDGGTIDGTTIGANQSALGIFTTLWANSYRPMGSSSSDGMYLQSAGTVGFTANSRPAFRIVGIGATGVNYVSVHSASTGSIPGIRATGDTNANLGLSSSGTGAIYFSTNSTAQTQFRVDHLASAVDYMVIKGAAAGGTPEIFATGTDTDIGFKITPKGAGLLQFGTTGCFTANSSSSISVTALGPLGMATATIKKWLTIKDSAGSTLYIPAWGN